MWCGERAERHPSCVRGRASTRALRQRNADPAGEGGRSGAAGFDMLWDGKIESPRGRGNPPKNGLWLTRNGWFRISARARMASVEPEVFAVADGFSRNGRMCCSFASFSGSMWRRTRRPGSLAQRGDLIAGNASERGQRST